MPFAARLGPVLTQAYFNRYSHLFSLFEMGSNPPLLYVQRAGLPLPSEPDVNAVDDAYLLEEVKAPFAFAHRDDRPTRLTFVMGRVSKTAREAIRLRYGSLSEFVKKHPEHFVMRPNEQEEGKEPTARLRQR
jgi:hypothetical protein